MKTCLDDANADCDGKWKAEDCSSSLSYVCQIPCKKIPSNKDILLPEIVLTFHCLNKFFLTVSQNNFGNKVPLLWKLLTFENFLVMFLS